MTRFTVKTEHVRHRFITWGDPVPEFLEDTREHIEGGLFDSWLDDDRRGAAVEALRKVALQLESLHDEAMKDVEPDDPYWQGAQDASLYAILYFRGAADMIERGEADG